jgi:hypothetical protein
MIGYCREYLITLLNQAGITRVYAEAEDAGKHQVRPYAQLIPGNEKLEYDGSLVAKEVDRENRQCTYRRRIYRHTAQIKVKIVHRDGNAAAQVKQAFLAGLERRIWDGDNNAILVSVATAQPEDDPSLLKQQDVVYLTVTFQGGVYRDHTVDLVNLDSALKIEAEYEEV